MSQLFVQIIKELEGEGLTHEQIAGIVGGSQSNISQIKGGTEPRHGLGQRLIRLHQKTCPDSSVDYDEDSADEAAA